jgi:archaellum biogenesis ATPase FlaH
MNTELPTHAVKYTMFFNPFHFYGKVKKQHDIAFTGTRKACEEFIKKSNDNIYYLYHNEHTRWKLRIVTINSLKELYKNRALQFTNPQ